MSPVLSRLVLVVLAALPAGCAGLIPAADPRQPGPVPPGSVLQLHQALPLAEGRARAFIQGGRQLAYGELRRYQPQCYLEHREVSRAERPISIPAGRYRILAGQARLQQVVLLAPEQLAGRGDWSQVIELLYLPLQAEDPAHAGVLQLACGRGFGMPAEAALPTLQQIQVTLGTLASLHLNGGRGGMP